MMEEQAKRLLGRRLVFDFVGLPYSVLPDFMYYLLPSQQLKWPSSPCCGQDGYRRVRRGGGNGAKLPVRASSVNKFDILNIGGTGPDRRRAETYRRCAVHRVWS